MKLSIVTPKPLKNIANPRYVVQKVFHNKWIS